MKSPILFLTFLLSVPATFAAAQRAALPSGSVADKPSLDLDAPAASEDGGESRTGSPIQLGAETPEGFDDPAHLYFFRYQAFLRGNGLSGLDAEAWKNLSKSERAAKIKTGETWLKNKFGVFMNTEYLSESDAALLDAVWGPDVASAAAAVGKAMALGDPDQIREARKHVQGLVKDIGSASVDWGRIFDASRSGDEEASTVPDPLALEKNRSGFLASLQSKDVRAPLESKAAFVEFLNRKMVPDDALPALTAMYDVFTRAKEPERSETAHILPTVVRFLNDGKKIADEPGDSGALAFAVPGQYDKPDRVAITPLVRSADPVEIGSLLSHEFEHVYDMYTGRYYTLDSELRGFKTNVMFFEIMKKDPRMSKKLAELTNSDNDATRGYFQDISRVAAAYAASPQTFADMVAFGHSYNSYSEGSFQGRLTLREAVDPGTGLQRQISGEKVMLASFDAQADSLRKHLTAIQNIPQSIANEKDIEKTTIDLSNVEMSSIAMRRNFALDSLRLGRMQREQAWMDRRAADAGQAAPAYDLSLPIDKNYIVGD